MHGEYFSGVGCCRNSIWDTRRTTDTTFSPFDRKSCYGFKYDIFNTWMPNVVWWPIGDSSVPRVLSKETMCISMDVNSRRHYLSNKNMTAWLHLGHKSIRDSIVSGLDRSNFYLGNNPMIFSLSIERNSNIQTSARFKLVMCKSNASEGWPYSTQAVISP